VKSESNASSDTRPNAGSTTAAEDGDDTDDGHATREEEEAQEQARVTEVVSFIDVVEGLAVWAGELERTGSKDQFVQQHQMRRARDA